MIVQANFNINFLKKILFQHEDSNPRPSDSCLTFSHYIQGIAFRITGILGFESLRSIQSGDIAEITKPLTEVII